MTMEQENKEIAYFIKTTHSQTVLQVKHFQNLN